MTPKEFREFIKEAEKTAIKALRTIDEKDRRQLGTKRYRQVPLQRAELISDAEFAANAKKIFREKLGCEDELGYENLINDRFDAEFVELICKHEGHWLVPNHCGKPEHDYCSRCNTPRPLITGFIAKDFRNE